MPRILIVVRTGVSHFSSWLIFRRSHQRYQAATIIISTPFEIGILAS
uniref:Uncharacterized protein n=1 Tax=Triticum urartu TaxID=4572 RepID=A0A8R7PBS5_TRIUA